MKIACVQVNAGKSEEENWQRVAKFSREAVRAGADVVVLPEMFAYMGPDVGRLRVATGIQSGIFEKIRDLAKEMGAYIVGGSHPEISPLPNRVFNTCLVVNALGEDVSVYRKIHLFNLCGSQGEKLYCESDTFVAGKDVSHFEMKKLGEQWNAMVGICYDLRFPELFRCENMKDNSPGVVFLPAAFTHATGAAHWEVLLRARAIENQCYVVACNQTGFFDDGAKRNFGHSMVVSPWGDIVGKLDEEEGVLLAEIDMGLVSETRKKLPAIHNRVF